MARAADRRKDQSYMLWAVPPAVLARLEFPLGELTKDEVRAAAAEAGLEVADEPESQEVCFAVGRVPGLPRGHAASSPSRATSSTPAAPSSAAIRDTGATRSGSGEASA